MSTGLNSRGFSSCSRMRKAGGRSTHDPTDVALLNMTVDSQSLFRRKVSGISLSMENPAMMKFSALFSRKQIANSPVYCERCAPSLQAFCSVTPEVSRSVSF